MPIYEFKCERCKSVFEEFFHSSNFAGEALVCPKCGSTKAKKQLSVFATEVSQTSSDFSSGSCSTGSCSTGMCGLN